ncbi:MAG TPA: 30S ribosomal protein S18 [Ruminococcaceae bacterium]|nr:30S ribosomal protein S18 [Oscillospiraceae bacterium]
MEKDRGERAEKFDKGGRGGVRKTRKKVCAFCAGKIDNIDYKDAAVFKRYLSDRAKIVPRRVTGTCARHQRQLTIAVKRARHLAIIPYVSD